MRRGARTSASAPMRLAAGADELRLDAAEMFCLWSRSNTARLVESIRLPDERVDVDAAVNGVGDNQDESGRAAAVRARDFQRHAVGAHDAKCAAAHAGEGARRPLSRRRRSA